MHFGYYLRRTAIERLREDVIVPAQRKGYGEIDLVGISLGGFGALYYAMHHPGEIARLFLLAPYLGEQPVVREICTAGGVKNTNDPTGEYMLHERARTVRRTRFS